jgi:hypothetical protein
MKATLPKENTDNARQPDKPLLSSYCVVARVPRSERYPAGMAELVTCRTYMSQSRNASVVYACVWGHSVDRTRYVAGRGNAGGYGYHKPSAAVSAALRSAGVTLSESIDGRGSSALRDALIALAVALGAKASQCLIVES